MSKHGFLTPKAISNRIKAKGLQKLRWYCEMCQKQCRDENGFKCHTMSESHMRQMSIFRENPLEMMEKFSREFEVKKSVHDCMNVEWGCLCADARTLCVRAYKFPLHTKSLLSRLLSRGFARLGFVHGSSSAAWSISRQGQYDLPGW